MYLSAEKVLVGLSRVQSLQHHQQTAQWVSVSIIEYNEYDWVSDWDWYSVQVSWVSIEYYEYQMSIRPLKIIWLFFWYSFDTFMSIMRINEYQMSIKSWVSNAYHMSIKCVSKEYHEYQLSINWVSFEYQMRITCVSNAYQKSILRINWVSIEYQLSINWVFNEYQLSIR